MTTKSRFKMKPLLAALITATALTASIPVTTQKAEALMPVTDIANFIVATWSDLQRTIESSQAIAVLQSTLTAIGDYAEMGVENMNNGFANVVARLGKGEEERQNLEQLERSSPAIDACATIAASSNLNDAACAGEDSLEKFVGSRAKNNSMSTGGGKFECKSGQGCKFIPGVPPSADDVNKKNAFDAVTTLDACEKLTVDGRSLCEKPSLMLFGQSLTKQEYEAVDLQIGIATNIEKPVPHADASLNKDSTEFKRARAQDIRRENIRETAAASLKNLHVLHNGTNENGVRLRGEVEVLEDFMADRIGNEKWLCEVSQLCGKDYVGPSEISRREVQMDAVALYIGLQHYKSSLRVEKLLADLSLMEIESVSK